MGSLSWIFIGFCVFCNEYVVLVWMGKLDFSVNNNPNMNILSSFIQSHVVPNQYDFIFFWKTQKKKRYFEEHWYSNNTWVHWLPLSPFYEQKLKVCPNSRTCACALFSAVLWIVWVVCSHWCKNALNCQSFLYIAKGEGLSDSGWEHSV